MKEPIYKGCKPTDEMWLDSDTFVVYFEEREDILHAEDGDVETTNTLYAEIHVDENNDVYIGENVYEKGTQDFIDCFYKQCGSEMLNQIEMSDELAKEIADYAMEAMKESLK